MIAFFFLLLLIIAVGILTVRAIGASSSLPLSLSAALGSGLGVGVASSAYFLFLNLLQRRAIFATWALEIVLLSVLCVINKRMTVSKASHSTAVLEESVDTKLFSPCVIGWMKAGFCGLFVLAALSFAARSWMHPHSDWDALMIWNVHARFLERAPEHLQNNFSPLIFWTHPDYPLLIPAIVSLGLAMTHESQLPAMFIGFLFTMVSAGLLVTSLSSTKTIVHGLLAGIVLLSTPFWVHCGAMQYGDVPISFFFLATLVCCALFDREKQLRFMILAGAFASLAAWTKNEGLLFILCLPVASLLAERKLLNQVKPVTVAALGALPVMLLLIWFKLTLAPPNDIVAGQGLSVTISRLMNLSRFIVVGEYFAVTPITFGAWIVSPIPFLVLLWFLTGSKLNDLGYRRALFAVILMTLGYAVTFLVTPSDIQQHLNTALTRLLLQLWPSFIFALVGSLSLKNPASAEKHSSQISSSN
jgi:hypothetical protein